MKSYFLASERLYLKPFDKDDFENIRQMNISKAVIKYTRQTQAIETGAETREYFNKIRTYSIKNEAKGLGYWACYEKESNKFVGRVVLRHFEYGEELREMGYSLLPQFWGKGYATEIAKELLHYGLHKLQLPKIIAIAAKENTASQKVLEKIGFSFIKETFLYETDVFHYEAQIIPFPS